jgi:hypothetical protein
MTALYGIFLDIQSFFEILVLSAMFTKVSQTEIYSVQFASSFTIAEMSYSHDKHINLRGLWRMSIVIFKRRATFAVCSF